MIEFTAEHRQFRAMVRQFIETEINPNGDKWEADGIFPAHDLFPQVGAQRIGELHQGGCQTKWLQVRWVNLGRTSVNSRTSPTPIAGGQDRIENSEAGNG